LSLFLNTASVEADVTSHGRPFHTFAPATGKARPPIVDRRQVGTSSRSVEADLSLRRRGMSATPVNDDAKYGGAEPCSARARYVSIATIVIIIITTSQVSHRHYRYAVAGVVCHYCITFAFVICFFNKEISHRWAEDVKRRLRCFPLIR